MSTKNGKIWRTFRDSVRTIMSQRNMKQKDLANRLRVTAKTMSNWLTGVSNPSTEMLFAMADELAVSLDRLVGRSPPGTETLPRLRELAEALNAALKLVPDEAGANRKRR